jgi:MFS family permease
LGPLKYRDFRLLWTGWLLGAAGSWVHQIASQWLILELTNSPFLLGVSGIFMSVPFLITSLYGGALADRMDRRKLLVYAQAINTVLAVVPAILAALGLIQVWHIYVLSFLTWTVNALDAPARQAIVPGLVPRNELVRAIALTSVVRRSTALIGPMIGGVSIAAVGVAGAFFIHSAFSLAVLLTLLFLRSPTTEQEPRTTSMGRSILDGLRFVRDNALVGAMLTIEAMNTMFAIYSNLLPVFARDVLHVGPVGLGLLYTAPGVGALVASGALVALGDFRGKGRMFLVAACLKPAAMGLFALSPWMPLSLLMLTLVGFFDVVGGTVRHTMLQLMTRDRMRGRVMSMDMMVHRGLGPISGVPQGAAATLLGAPLTLAGGCALVILYVLAVATRMPALRRWQDTPATAEAGAAAHGASRERPA